LSLSATSATDFEEEPAFVEVDHWSIGSHAVLLSDDPSPPKPAFGLGPVAAQRGHARGGQLMAAYAAGGNAGLNQIRGEPRE
jgi:hypothetical protein